MSSRETQETIAELEIRITREQEFLAQYEVMESAETDPRLRLRLQENIEEIKNLLLTLQTRLAQLRAEQAPPIAFEQEETVFKANVPYGLDSELVGRVDEMLLLDDWYQRDSGHPFLAVIGLGGIGKSALTWSWLQKRREQGLTPRLVVWWSFYEADGTMQKLLDTLLEAFGDDPAQFTSLRSAVDRCTYYLQRVRVLLLLDGAGRLAQEKSWDVLITAVAEVMQSVENVRLVILGEGDERKELEKLAKKLGVADRVDLPGVVPFEEIPGYLAAADLFCFASISETQGLVTMEAMASGLAVVAVEATGTSDVVESGVDGLLTSHDPHELAQAIVRVLQDDALRQGLKTAALDKVDTFDIKHQAQQMVGVYHQAIESHRNGRTIQVDKQKPLLEGKWYEILGMESNPFRI